jgi:hypothetical protein
LHLPKSIPYAGRILPGIAEVGKGSTITDPRNRFENLHLVPECLLSVHNTSCSKISNFIRQTDQEVEAMLQSEDGERENPGIFIYPSEVFFISLIDFQKKYPTVTKVITGETHAGTGTPKLSSIMIEPRKNTEYIAPFLR